MLAPPRPEQITADERMVPLSVHQGACTAHRIALERAEAAERKLADVADQATEHATVRAALEEQVVDLIAVELEVVLALRRGGVLREDETPTTAELAALMKRMRVG